MKKIFTIKRVIVLLILFTTGMFIFNYYRKWRDDSFDAEILSAGEKYNINPALIKAVIWRESRFNPNAIGRSGEIGLMQIMPATAREWAESQKLKMFLLTDLFSPSRNIDCGTWYLKKALSRYERTDNPLPYGLAEYNAGRGNVVKWLKGPAETNSMEFIKNIEFPSTREYVLDILERFQHYHHNWLPNARAELHK